MGENGTITFSVIPYLNFQWLHPTFLLDIDNCSCCFYEEKTKILGPELDKIK